MPQKPPTACRFPNCPELTRENYCSGHKEHEKKIHAEYDARRMHDPFYNSPAWIALRTYHKRRFPLCQECERKGQTVPMKIVDHIKSIKQGGGRLDPDNLQSLCQECHNRKTGQDRRK